MATKMSGKMSQIARLARLSDPSGETVTDYEFNVLLLEAIDEALSSLGESAKKVIYRHLEEKFMIEKGQIPFKIEEFSDALEDIFGMGAKIIELQIMKNIYKKIGGNFRYSPKDGNLLFNAYLRAVKRHFIKKQKKTR